MKKVELKQQANIKAPIQKWALRGWGTQVIYDIFDGLLRSFLSGKKTFTRPYLFIGRSPEIAQSTLLPIIQEINISADVVVLPEHRVSGLTKLRKHGIPLSYWTEYIPIFSLPSIMKQARKLRTTWKQLRADLEAQAAFKYDDISIWSSIQSHLEILFLRHFPVMLLQTRALRHIFETIQPSALVTVAGRTSTDRLAINLARQYHVPSLYVQPAMISDSPHYGPLYADKAAVSDDFSHRIFINRGGVASERLAITGSPRFDDIPDAIANATRLSAQKQVREKLDLSLDEKFVVFATQPFSLSYTRKMIKAVIQALSKYPFLQLIIKVHPREPLEKYNALLSDLDWTSSKPKVVTEIDLYTLLATSELVISGFSNVILEAVLLDKPALVVNLTGEPDPLPFVQDGIALGAYNDSEVGKQFDKIMNDQLTQEMLKEHRKRYIYQNHQLVDGKSTQRVVELLRQMTISNEDE